MEIKFATMASDPELVAQYIKLRSEKHKKKDYPNAPKEGDDKAVFILAVEGNNIRVGMRLSEPDTEKKGWTPADRVPDVRLESMFKDHLEIAEQMRRKDAGRKVVFIDGIFGNLSVLDGFSKGKQTMELLLTRIYEYAKQKQYAMVYCFPEEGHAKAFLRFFKRMEDVHSSNLGAQIYTSDSGVERGHDRRLLAFFLDPVLQFSLRSAEPVNGHAVLPPPATWQADIAARQRDPGGPANKIA